MITTQGNFLTQGNKDFPVDCELFDGIQTNMLITQVIGNIAGDKAILYGCEQIGGNKRNAGYVFLRTADHPSGEVLYWTGGSTASGMYLKLEDIYVAVAGYDYPKAYTKRFLAAGIGTENYRWEDFKEIKTPVELEAIIKAQDDKIAALAPEPLGFPKIWAGVGVPNGYILCDGQMLKITDYPELYAALGTQYNTAPTYSGGKYTTIAGYFRVPDLRGRFVVGHSSIDDDYSEHGAAGGIKKHALTTDEIPSHVHEVKDYYYIEHTDYAGQGFDGHDSAGKTGIGGGKTDKDNSLLFYKKHNTESVGKGSSHENRPPYYTLAYILRAK